MRQYNKWTYYGRQPDSELIAVWIINLTLSSMNSDEEIKQIGSIPDSYAHYKLILCPLF